MGGEGTRATTRRRSDGPSDRMLRRGLEQAGRCRFREAERHLRGAVSEAPHDADAWTALGAVLRAQGRAAEARRTLRRALRLRPDHTVALAELASACRSLRRLTEAEVALREHVHLARGRADAQAALGDFLSRERGALQEAERCFRRAQHLDPKDPTLAVALGTHRIRAGDVRAGRKHLLCAARRGFAAAERELGQSLADANRERERARGSRWLTRAAGHGDPEACYELAVRLEAEGLGPANPGDVIAYYARASARGFAPAQVRLGRIYARAQGIPRDLERAARWYRAAAERGDAEGAHALGEVYDFGLGVDRDAREALRWYARAAQRGHADAQLSQALLLDSGELGWRDAVASRRWLLRAARQGSAGAEFFLGAASADEQGPKRGRHADTGQHEADRPWLVRQGQAAQHDRRQHCSELNSRPARNGDQADLAQERRPDDGGDDDREDR